MKLTVQMRPSSPTNVSGEDREWGILGVLHSRQRWSGSSSNFGNLKIGPGSWTPRAGMTEVGRASWEGAV